VVFWPLQGGGSSLAGHGEEKTVGEGMPVEGKWGEFILLSNR